MVELDAGNWGGNEIPGVTDFEWDALYLVKNYKDRVMHVPYWDEPEDNSYEPFVNHHRYLIEAISSGSNAMSFHLKAMDIDPDTEDGSDEFITVTRTGTPGSVIQEGNLTVWVYGDRADDDELTADLNTLMFTL